MKALSRLASHPWAAGGLLVVLAAVATTFHTDFPKPPRGDGVGYAILGASIAEDGDYREIDKPDRPRHAHFPPGYPLVLAGVWTLAGRSEPAAHAVSIVATVLAVLLSWRWFRSLYPPLAALGLSLALALNWTWTRLGGDIASEPVYQFWQMLALVLAGQVGRKGGMAGAGALGGALGMATLTRYVGAPLAAAITIDLALRSRFREAVVSTLVASFMFLPWLIWMLRAGPSSHLGLLPEATSLLSTIAHQSLFYLQRIPDQIVGPFVEVGTIYRRSMPVLIAVHVWAVLTTGLILTGWIISLSRPGAVLSGLVRVPLVVRDQCSRRTGRGRPVAPRNMPLQRGGNRGTRRIVALWSLGTLALLLVWPFTEAGRFLVPLVPALLVGAVEGLSTVLARLGFRRQARRVAVALVLLVSVPYSVHAVASHRPWKPDPFDQACLWLAKHTTTTATVLTHHPAELYWQSGRQAWTPEDVDLDDPAGLARRRIFFIVVEPGPPDDPLHRFVESYPNRVRLKMSAGARPDVRVYAVAW